MILHIGAYSSKHIMFPFIEFVHQYFNEDEHFYILCSSDKIKLPYKNTITKDIFKEQKYFIDMMNKADKIILHGVWYEEIPKIYLENKILFGKTLWAIWGGDYHCVDTISNEKKWLYENIKYIISGNKFSFDTLKRNYKINAKLLNCFLYPSNLVKSNFPRARCHDKTINIQIGNSANPTNRHLEAFEYIKHIKNHNIMIYCPLSYGNREYANQIIRKGKELFKDKFMAVEKVLSFDEYIKFLHTIDIGIFNHQKQEAFGNIITHLGFGNKVYFDENSEMGDVFKEYDLQTFDIQKFNLSKISANEKKQNIEIVKKKFSVRSLKNCLQKVFLYNIKVS